MGQLTKAGLVLYPETTWKPGRPARDTLIVPSGITYIERVIMNHPPRTDGGAKEIGSEGSDSAESKVQLLGTIDPAGSVAPEGSMGNLETESTVQLIAWMLHLSSTRRRFALLSQASRLRSYSRAELQKL